MKDIIFKEEVYAIVGAAMDVYWNSDRGFLEPVYQEALGIEFRRRGIPFEAHQEIVFLYNSHELTRSNLISYRWQFPKN